MNVNEVIKLIQQSFGKAWTRDDVKSAIEVGVALPVSGNLVQLEAHSLNGRYDVDDDQLNQFFSQFEAEQPSRHPPVHARRELLLEARHTCGICGEPGPIEFHHILEFHRLKHHDARHMLALCPNCHTRCGNGEIDQLSQRAYKKRLQARWEGHPGEVSVGDLVQFNWDDLREVVEAVHAAVVSGDTSTDSAYDFIYVELEEKDELNRMGDAYAGVIRQHHLPHFAQIKQFLGSPTNAEVREMYHEAVDELRTRMAANARLADVPFERVLMAVYDATVSREQGRLRGRTRTLNVVLSFMYASCDIGLKAPTP